MFGKKNKPSMLITDLTENIDYTIADIRGVEWMTIFKEKYNALNEQGK